MPLLYTRGGMDALGWGWAAKVAHAVLYHTDLRTSSRPGAAEPCEAWWGAAISNSPSAERIHAGATLHWVSGNSLDPVSTGTSVPRLAVQLRCAWWCRGAILKTYRHTGTEINDWKSLSLRLLFKNLTAGTSAVYIHPHMPLKIVSVQWDISLSYVLTFSLCIYI